MDLLDINMYKTCNLHAIIRFEKIINPVDLWTCGPEDLWTEDIHLYVVVWTCGPVDLRTCGPARHKYVRRHAICMQLCVLKK